MISSRLPLVFTCLLLTISCLISGQQQDFQTWTAIELRKDLGTNLTGSVELEQRFHRNSLRYDRTMATLGLKYDVSDRFSLTGGFRYQVVQDDYSLLKSRLRMTGDFSYAIELHSWKVILRERIQYGFDELATFDQYFGNSLYSRSRAGVEYHIFATPITLYSSYEIYFRLNSVAYPLHSKNRVVAGVDYRFSPSSSLSMHYLFEGEVNRSNPLNAHVLVTTWTIRF